MDNVVLDNTDRMVVGQHWMDEADARMPPPLTVNNIKLRPVYAARVHEKYIKVYVYVPELNESHCARCNSVVGTDLMCTEEGGTTRYYCKECKQALFENTPPLDYTDTWYNKATCKIMNGPGKLTRMERR